MSKSGKKPKAVTTSMEEEMEMLRAQLHAASFEISRSHAELARTNSELLRQRELLPKVSPTTVVQCPVRYIPPPSSSGAVIFLCGPIHSDDWQKSVISRLEGRQMIIYNPRREDWKAMELTDGVEQISWESEYLDRSNISVFWFSWDHPNLIGTLMQLGRELARKRCIFVGVHVNTKDKKLIHEFIKRYNPEIAISGTLDKLISGVVYFIQHGTLQPRRTTNSSDSASNSSGMRT